MRFADDEFGARLADEAGTRPPWAPESCTGMDADVRRSPTRMIAGPSVAHRDEVRGFVCPVTDGSLREVG